MKNFTGERDSQRRDGGYRGGDRGGKPSFAKKTWSSDRPAMLYKATCAECGKMCEVPFRPNGEKPVYCNDCFNKKRDPSDTRGARSDYGAPKSFPQRDFNDRFAPKHESRDFAPSARPAFKPVVDNSKQLADISTKLDRLITAIEKMSLSTPEVSAAIVATTKAVAKELPIKKASKPKATKKKVVSKKKK